MGLSDIRTIFFGFGLRTCSKNYEIATPDLKQVKRYFHFLKFLRTTTLSIVNKAIDKKKKNFLGGNKSSESRIPRANSFIKL